MSTSMNYWLYLWRQGELESDVTWRAYDISASRKPMHVKQALKSLGLNYAGEHGVAQFRAFYEIPSYLDAEILLACWWIWMRLSKGRRVRGVPLRVPRGRSEATTLAPDPPKGLQTPSEPAPGGA